MNGCLQIGSGESGAGGREMRWLKYVALLAVLMIPLTYSQAQVSFGIGFGPGYVTGPPICAYGYYGYPPYACAPYGYYGPSWFVGGVFVGAGPWYGGYYGRGWGRGYYGRGGWGRGYYGRGGWGYGRGYSHGAYGGRGYAGGPGGGYHGSTGGGSHGAARGFSGGGGHGGGRR